MHEHKRLALLKQLLGPAGAPAPVSRAGAGQTAGGGGRSAPIFSREERMNKILGGGGGPAGDVKGLFGKWPL